MPQPFAITPVWLALQPHANARLCLFEVDRPGSREPVPIRRHVLDAFLRQDGVIDGSSDTSLTDPGDVRFSGHLCRAATLPVATRNAFDWLASELAWEPALLGSVVAPCEGVIWLGDLALLQPEGLLPDAPKAQFAACRVQQFGARYGSGGLGRLLQPLLGEAIELVLSPHRVLVLRPGDTLTLLAGRYGTTVDTLRRLNPSLRAAAPEISLAGDTLVIVARSCQCSVALLRDDNPDYARWPQYELLPVGIALQVPAIRPSTLLQPGQALLVPAFLPSSELPAGQWIDLPRGRTSALPLDAWDTSLPPPPV